MLLLHRRNALGARSAFARCAFRFTKLVSLVRGAYFDTKKSSRELQCGRGAILSSGKVRRASSVGVVHIVRSEKLLSLVRGAFCDTKKTHVSSCAGAVHILGMQADGALHVFAMEAAPACSR